MHKKALIITGGSKGIGFASIQIFAENGWDCINISRQLCTYPGTINFNCDLRSEDWEQTIDFPKLLAHYQQIALVHNAACCMNDSMVNLESTQLRQTLELNIIAANRLNQQVIPHLKDSSAILYIGSTLSEKAVPNTASYTISKHAIVGMMRATCQDLIGTGIHTGCICPGITDTEMLRQRVNNDANILNQLAQLQSMNRLIDPREIAEVIYFCANHPVINGSVIHSHLGQREN